ATGSELQGRAARLGCCPEGGPRSKNVAPKGLPADSLPGSPPRAALFHLQTGSRRAVDGGEVLGARERPRTACWSLRCGTRMPTTRDQMPLRASASAQTRIVLPMRRLRRFRSIDEGNLRRKSIARQSLLVTFGLSRRDGGELLMRGSSNS